MATLLSVWPALPAHAVTATAGLAIYHADIVTVTGTFRDGTPWRLDAGRVQGGTALQAFHYDGFAACVTVGRANKQVKQCADRPAGQFDASTADLRPFHFTLYGVALRDGPRSPIHVDMTVSVTGSSQVEVRPNAPYPSPRVATEPVVERYRPVQVIGNFRYGNRTWAGAGKGFLDTYERVLGVVGINP